MHIWDTAGTARALYDLVTHNRLACQLAIAWDKQHSNDWPIVHACQKLEQDWGSVVWANRWLSLLESTQSLIILVGMVASVVSMYLIGWCCVVVYVFFAALLMINIGLSRKMREKIGRYCKLGTPLQLANLAIRQVCDRYKALGDVADILKFMDALCLLIVKRDKLGIYKLKEVLPIGSDDILIAENQDDLKEFFRCSLSEVGQFGLTTVDPKVHYAKAHAKWLEMVTRGEILTDYQI